MFLLNGRRPVSKRHEYEYKSELEEERRLFYVALTRAEHQAYLLMRNRVIVGVNSQIVSLRVLLKK
jgi:ATP-dependent exoDNAse (exonuclease V) beta subunit